MAETEQTTRTYRGNCHCAAFIYEITVPEIKFATACNCSICVKKGSLYLFPGEGLKIIKGGDDLVSYTFGEGNYTHQFCGNCGNAVLVHNPKSPPGMKTNINVRTLQDVDAWKIEIRQYDGAKVGSPYVPPVYSGPEPTAEFEGGKVYHGSCHCGAVTAAVKVKDALEGENKELIMECNCSHCRRGGYIWLYPKKGQLLVEGGENLTHYTYGSHVWRKSFCKTCGVFVFSEPRPMTEEEVAALPEAARGFYLTKGDWRPFTLRALNNFDLSIVKPIQADGWGRGDPKYVNP
ncbi:Mss4-like protein [Bombardia bombarda]|uniref:Mss4-like protein n=1 Tax=Bombardia bombarda TaxID=252184 RepID=A0AA39WU39_9PEZI|nr:Mss4-like protein [Bombardia bombarda]